MKLTNTKNTEVKIVLVAKVVADGAVIMEQEVVTIAAPREDGPREARPQ